MTKFAYSNLDVDGRLFKVNKVFNDDGEELILVKGIVWNKGKLLEGADFDFYLRQDGIFKDYDNVSDDKKAFIQSILKGFLISPRKTDHHAKVRCEKIYFDAEMTLHDNYANLDFANNESAEFFENGYLQYPENFETNIHLVRFILNRFLEETGVNRVLSLKNYESLIEFTDNLSNGLYREILSSFSVKNGACHPPQSLEYKKIVLKYVSEGIPKEDLIYIKPLNRAYKNLNLGGRCCEIAR